MITDDLVAAHMDEELTTFSFAIEHRDQRKQFKCP